VTFYFLGCPIHATTWPNARNHEGLLGTNPVHHKSYRLAWIWTLALLEDSNQCPSPHHDQLPFESEYNEPVNPVHNYEDRNSQLLFYPPREQVAFQGQKTWLRFSIVAWNQQYDVLGSPSQHVFMLFL
jgi:hypothetical protein